MNRQPQTIYHFDFGNSNTGPVGYCASVRAATPVEAVRLLREALPEESQVPLCPDVPEVGYVAVYFNPDAITVADIDEPRGAVESARVVAFAQAEVAVRLLTAHGSAPTTPQIVEAVSLTNAWIDTLGDGTRHVDTLDGAATALWG